MKTLLVSFLLGMTFQGLRAQAQNLEAVHEWGTFTTFSGSDGTPLAWWSPVLEGPAALPEFVQPVASKLVGFHALRMETPVLYFYAKQPTEVNVRVDYHQGVVTEIFPPGQNVYFPSAVPNQTSSTYSWAVGLLPPDSPEGSSIPKVGQRGAHYAHAREVPDAWLVSAKHRLPDGREFNLGTEKFIFYRGAGGANFPLSSSLREDGSLLVYSRSEVTTDAFFMSVSKGVVQWRGTKLAFKPDAEGRVEAVTMATPKIEGAAETRTENSADDLAKALRQTLTTAGLTPAEAAAMVATWQEAWLGEDGTRLLYVIPEAWINERLPLQITPAPKELKRVFVARNELFSPQQEQVLVKALTETPDQAERAKLITSLNLGRFAHPALERAVKINEQKLRMAFYDAVQKP